MTMGRETTQPASALTVNAARARLIQGVDVRQRLLEVNGITTSVLECGEGPPLVLLHGGIECGGVYWAPIMPQLAESYHLIVPDVPGLGESAPVKRLDIEAFSSWFEDLLGLTCAARPLLVAHSLLGTMAARYAARRPNDIEQLVLYAVPGVGPYRMPLGLRVVAVMFALRPTKGNAERFDRWAFADYDRARGQNGEWLAAFNDYTRYRAMVPHVKRTMRQLIGACTRRVPDEELRGIGIPTSLLWGRRDRFVAVGLGEAASARLGWPLQVVEDAGHVPHIEQSEAFLRSLGVALNGGTAAP